MADTITVRASGLAEPVMWTARMPREMTADDLGLRWQNNYIAGYYRCCEGEPTEPDGWCGLCGTLVSDAPYSFWLGADHG